jgi:hypothetical protein
MPFIIAEHLLQLGFFPRNARRILSHLETRHGDTAASAALLGAFEVSLHVGPFRYRHAAVLYQHRCF